METKCLWDIIDGLRDELNIASDGITDLNDVVSGLQVENKHLILSNERRGEMVRELQAENKRLKENVDNYPTDRYDFKCIEENTKLKAENKRLVEQVSSISSNSSSTHTHTLGSVRCSIAREIAEYMSHNEGCGGARLFLIPRDEFKHGEYDNTIYWDDGME